MTSARTPGELHDRKSPESRATAGTPGELHDGKSPESRATAGTPGELHDRKSPESKATAGTPSGLHDRKSPESRATREYFTLLFSIFQLRLLMSYMSVVKKPWRAEHQLKRVELLEENQ